ncbi:MAG TPA: Rne/Rng family ribonuclease [Terriglobales bacterium]|nr:Rne/Rng family ribonuclease [Terriglobales bacterium]
MSKELFVSSTPHETKLAIVEDDQLTEVYFERENEYTLAGSIYKGRVTRVLPGMQSAFVDIGLERDAFLYVSDFMEESDSDEEIESSPAPQSRDRAPREERNGHQREERSATPTAVFEGGEEFDELAGESEAAEAELDAEADTENEAEGQAEEAAAGEGGARPWRGRRRRGRRRGHGSDEQPKQAEAEPTTAAPSQTASPSEFQPMILPGESIAKFNRPADQTSSTEQAGGSTEGTTSAEQHEGRAAPPERRDFRDRDRGRDRGWRRDRDRRGPRRDFRSEEADFGPPPGYKPIVLPGESIAKYRGAAVEEPQQETSADQPRTSAGEAESHPVSPANSWAFNAETPASSSESSHSQTPPHSRRDSIDIAPVFGGSEAAEPRSAVEQEVEREFPAPHSHEQTTGRAAETPEEAEFEPEPHGEHGSVGGTVLDGAPEAQQDQDEEITEGQEDPAESSTTGTAATSNFPEPHEFAPGAGHLEEEEIEEEEAEPFSFAEELEDDEFEELEEQIMDRVAERAGEVAAGLQLTEAVEESDASRHAEEAYEGLEGEGEPVEIESEFTDEADAAQAAAEEGDAQPNGRAEMRAPASTAGFQQRTDRGSYERRRQGRGGRRGGPRKFMRRYEPRQLPQISDLLKEGQEVLVQIAKEPIAKKGARITSHIALPGRFLVYMPTVDHIGVSRKISSDEERQRLKRIVLSERENGHGGFIVRTAADRADEKELRADIQFLKNLWHEIRERMQKAKPPALIYHDLNLVERILRDQVNQNFATIWVDSEPEYERVVRFVNRFQPGLVKRVKLYTKETPLFEQFNIQEEINKALKSKVWLKSGGYIVINQTEALVAIDVNTGKYVGKTARLEDTIVKTNVDAIKEIVRQIRLRDLGGIIVVDFIDMDERRNRQKVMQALEEALRQDRAPSKVLQFNDFGLVAITRKRVKQSLERTLGSPCPYCSATGLVKSVTTICNEIWIEMRKMSHHFEKPDVMLRVNPEVAKALKQNNGRWIQELEELTGRNLIVKSDPTLHQEQFDIT